MRRTRAATLASLLVAAVLLAQQRISATAAKGNHRVLSGLPIATIQTPAPATPPPPPSPPGPSPPPPSPPPPPPPPAPPSSVTQSISVNGVSLTSTGTASGNTASVAVTTNSGAPVASSTLTSSAVTVTFPATNGVTPTLNLDLTTATTAAPSQGSALQVTDFVLNQLSMAVAAQQQQAPVKIAGPASAPGQGAASAAVPTSADAGNTSTGSSPSLVVPGADPSFCGTVSASTCSSGCCSVMERCFAANGCTALSWARLICQATYPAEFLDLGPLGTLRCNAGVYAVPGKCVQCGQVSVTCVASGCSGVVDPSTTTQCNDFKCNTQYTCAAPGGCSGESCCLCQVPGQSCGASSACGNGVCESGETSANCPVDCPPQEKCAGNPKETTDCDGTCVDLQTSKNNCGACGVSCGDYRCVSGECEFPPSIASTTKSLPITASSLTITGTGFDPSSPEANTVLLGSGAIGRVTAATETTLVVELTTKPLILGPIDAVVTSRSLSSGANTQVGTVVPSVTRNINTYVAISAPSLTIYGQGFGLSNTVVLDRGAAGIVTSSTSTSLVVELTVQPTSVGPITAVVTSLGQYTSVEPVQVATIVSAPAVTPSSECVVTNVVKALVIEGSRFDGLLPAANTVSFNRGAVGVVVGGSRTRLEVSLTTPPTSAGPLTAVVTSFGGPSGDPVQVAQVQNGPTVDSSSEAIYAETGAQIVITGKCFDGSSASGNLVQFDRGAEGTVSQAFSTTLTVELTTPPSSTGGNLSAIVTSFKRTNGEFVSVGKILLPSLYEWISVTSSADGNRLAAAQKNGNIWYGTFSFFFFYGILSCFSDCGPASDEKKKKKNSACIFFFRNLRTTLRDCFRKKRHDSFFRIAFRPFSFSFSF